MEATWRLDVASVGPRRPSSHLPARPAGGADFRAGLEATNRRSWSKARRHFRDAIGGHGPDVVWAVQELIQTYLGAGDPAGGERWIASGLPPGPLRDHARGYLLRRTGRRDEALALLDRAWNARPRMWATAIELGRALCIAGRRGRGLRLLRQAENHFRRRGDDWGRSAALSLRAGDALERLDLDSAVNGYRHALALKRRCGDRLGVGTALHNLGLAHYYRAEFDHAEAALEQALLLQRGRGDLPGTAVTLNTLGLVELDLANPTRAAQYLHESVRACRRLGETNLLAAALGNLAEAHRLRGEHGTAAVHLRQARDLQRACRKPDEWGMVVANLAMTLVAQGQPGAALAEIAAHPAAAVKAANVRTRFVLGRERARATLALGHAAPALRLVRTAVALVERERPAPHTQVALLDARAIEGEALLALERPAEVLPLARRLSRRVDLLLSRHRQAGTRIGLLETNRRVHDLELSALAALGRHPGAAWRVTARLKARELAGAGEGRRRPSHAAGNIGAPGPGEALIEYHVAAHTTFAFARAGASWRWLDLGIGERRLALAIARLLEPLRRAGKTHDPAMQLTRFEPRRAQALARLLITPVLAGLLGGLHRLLIVPHGPLHTLPFEVLLEAADPGGRACAVTYLPSSRARRLPHRAPPRRLTGVAYSPPHAAIPGLVPLPGATREVRAAARLYPKATLLLGAAATAPALARAAEDTPVLHVAAHARAHFTEPARSAIWLAPEAPGRHDGGDEPAALSAPGIAALLLRASPLVVLSACEGHLGRVRLHEGSLGLARAFLEAGAEAVIASLWRVDDAATLPLMIELHRRLRAGDARGEALARAKASLRARTRFAHPYFWASFILIDRRLPPLSGSSGT